MSTENLNRCPHCGGTIELDEQSATLRCSYCQSIFTHEQLKANSHASTPCDTDTHNEYTCNSCGAVMVVDENTLTSQCAYCGNTSIIKNRVSGKYRPDYIIPFRISPDVAKSNFLSVLKGRNHIKQRFRKGFEVKDVTSLFVPFWLYDCVANGSCEYHLPDGRVQSANFSERYAKVPVDASVRLDDNYMDVLEPFSYADLKPFDKVYLIGHMAERYDTDVKIMGKRANSKVKRAVKTSVARHVAEDSSTLTNATFSGALQGVQGCTNAIVDRLKTQIDSSSTDNVNFQVDRELILDGACVDSIKHIVSRVELTSYKYALFPIYLLRGEYNGKSFLYAINGQNGKVSGKFPYSRLANLGSNLIGVGFGALMFSGVVSVALHFIISSLGISSLKAFGITYLLSFLLLILIEFKTNRKENRSQNEQLLGLKPTVSNAKAYRVSGSFKLDLK